MSLNFGREYSENVRTAHTPMFHNQPAEATEAMTGYTDVGGGNRTASALRKKYLKALNRYNSLEKQIQEEILRGQTRLTEVQQYLGKRSRRPNGDLVYVNDYGYTTAYVDSESPASATCNEEPLSIARRKVKFLRDSGTMASPAMPCGLAGKNIKNEDSEETAWVDIKGRKHIYSDATWSSKQAACNVLPVLLPAREYDLIPEGSAMQSTSACLAVDVDPHLWASKQKALDRLMDVTAEMEERTDELEIQDAKLNAVTKVTRLVRMHVDNEQDKTRKELNTFRDHQNDTQGELESTQLVLVSRRLQLLVWMLLCFTVFAVLMHALAFGPGKLGDAVLLAVSLVIIYIVARSLWWWAANY